MYRLWGSTRKALTHWSATLATSLCSKCSAPIATASNVKPLKSLKAATNKRPRECDLAPGIYQGQSVSIVQTQLYKALARQPVSYGFPGAERQCAFQVRYRLRRLATTGGQPLFSY